MPRKKKIENDVVTTEPVNLKEPVKESPYYPIPDYKGINFTDALRSIGERADYANRKAIATKNGIENYLSLGAQNKVLLDKLLKGELLK